MLAKQYAGLILKLEKKLRVKFTPRFVRFEAAFQRRDSRIVKSGFKPADYLAKLSRKKLETLIKFDMMGLMSTKLRDGSFRFVQIGQDPCIHICVGHDDEWDALTEIVGEYPDLVIYADESHLLGETDIFDN